MNEQEQFEYWWDQDCDTTMNSYSNTSMMYWAWEAWKAAKKVEREACALVCLMPVDEMQITDDCSEYVYKDHLDCAAAIRARGQE
jgi:hypothetical protein